MLAQATVTAGNLLAGLIGGVGGALITVFANYHLHKLNYTYRLKFEKEYAKYERLWKAFFRCRRSLSDLTGGLTLGSPAPREQIAKVYDTFQRSVRLEEPFLHEDVLLCARRALKLGSRMFGNVRSIETISKMRRQGVGFDQDEKLADKQIERDSDNDFCLEAIEREMEELSRTIRNRLAP